jgi:hypothetical protein
VVTDNADVVYLATLQFAHGGLFDAVPADKFVHAVRGTRRGTPGPTLCGIDRMAEDTPGWSVGGGTFPAGYAPTGCPGCVEVARREFPGRPVAGSTVLSGPLAEAIGVGAFNHSSGALRAVPAQERGNPRD